MDKLPFPVLLPCEHLLVINQVYRTLMTFDSLNSSMPFDHDVIMTPTSLIQCTVTSK